MNLVVDKLYHLTCMECQREAEDQTSAPSFGTGNNNNKEEQITTTTKENQRDDDSSNEEEQQLLYDRRCFKEKI